MEPCEPVCPIARALRTVGERWKILILRGLLNGVTRFDELEKNLAIAPNILSKRLKSLVDAGLVEKHFYSMTPPRNEYILLNRERSFRMC